MSDTPTKREPTSIDTVGQSPRLILRLLPPLFFLGVGVMILHQCATSLREQGYDTGTPITNAALYPRILVTVLLTMSVTQIIKEIRNLGTEMTDDMGLLTHERLIQVVQCTGLGLAYLILLPIIGYLAMTPLFVALVLLSLGDRHILNIVIFSILLTIGCSLMFQGVFNVNLPRGLFGIALNI